MCFTGHVRRSKTFNVSDVHDQLGLAGVGPASSSGSPVTGTSLSPASAAGGGGVTTATSPTSNISSSSSAISGTKTLPKPDKNRTSAASYAGGPLRPTLIRAR